MKKITIIAVAISIAVALTAFFFLVNDVVISIRLNELRENLLEQNRAESNMDHIALIATYRINKNIYEKKISQENADALEARISSLAREDKAAQPAVRSVKYDIISRSALGLINFNRMIIGKPFLKYRRTPSQNFTDLDTAYFYERNYLFNRAIELYDKVLKNVNLDNALRSSVLLHQGYCYALAGLDTKAMNNYSVIINKYVNENSAVTAAILSRYLEGFNVARERVLSSTADPLQRSQDLVNLLAYKQALGILEEEEKKADVSDIPRIKYFKARCLTGMGQPEKAVVNYLQVITSSPSSQYAKYSNRKLFMIGTRAGGNNSITKLSEKLNAKLNDPSLTEMVENQKDNPEQEIEVQNFENIKIPEELLEKTEKLTETSSNSEKISRYMIIQTSDGNTFKGTLIEQSDMEISLQTSIGRINVKRDKITSITAK